ncbi:MAG: FHA domain-containing protein [Proteobacteria bacterium]|nr:FHA domain-containing protein [Pseudomonadota bacterium]
MNDNYQSGKTQAIDLDELHVQSANRPEELRVRGEFELENWKDDPWASTEESRKRRRWADDERWSGDDEEKQNKPEGFWDADEEAMKAGWQAPKRGDVLVANEGWDDWDNFGGAPKELDEKQESKEFGGFRRVQAASQYAQVDTSDYVDGRAQRDDLYHSKEVYGTANVKERRDDPYADLPAQERAPMPEMKPISEWEDESPKAAPAVSNEEDMRPSAKINQTQTGDDIPGVTRASIIIFQSDAEPVIFEIKKIVTTIGRGLDNMVILNDQYASRQHLRIQYVSGRFELYALSIDNLASVNGYPISHIVLMNNDQIEVGATRIRFVLGPISDQHMVMSAPLNGLPMHLDAPPQEVRSPKTTRKNLILLIAAISVIVLFLLGIFISLLFKDNDDPVIAEAENIEMAESQEDAEAGAGTDEAREASSEAQMPAIELTEEDQKLIDGMLEAYSLGAGEYSAMASVVPLGDTVSITIKTNQPEARIYNADGSLRGITSADDKIKSADDKIKYEGKESVHGRERHEILTIRKDGFKDKDIDIVFKDTIDEMVELEPEAPAEPPKAEPKPAPKPKPKAKKKPAKRKPGTTKRRIMI